MNAPAPRAWNRDGRDWPNREASVFVRTGGVAWHVQRMGSGPRLLLLHGTGGATHSWRGLLPALADRFDVVAPDLPGHGFSSMGMASLPGMAGAVRDLLATLDVAPEYIVGHSAGAAIALRLTLDRAVQPRVVIGLNAALTPFRGLAASLFPTMAKALALNPATAWVFSGVAGWQFQAKRLIASTGSEIDAEGLALYARLFARPDHVSGALSMMANWDVAALSDELADLGVPMHLITALGDKAIPPEGAKRLAAQHAHVTMHEISNLGHLMHEEDPGRVADLIFRTCLERQVAI